MTNEITGRVRRFINPTYGTAAWYVTMADGKELAVASYAVATLNPHGLYLHTYFLTDDATDSLVEAVQHEAGQYAQSR